MLKKYLIILTLAQKIIINCYLCKLSFYFPDQIFNHSPNIHLLHAIIGAIPILCSIYGSLVQLQNSSMRSYKR